MSEVSIQPDISHSPKMDEFLNHHGIKGMKWGVRRTPEQLGHATARMQAGGENKSAKKAPEKKNTERSAWKAYSLSDDELQKRINRLNMEQKYSDLLEKLNDRPGGIGEWVKDTIVKQGKRFGENMVSWAFDTAFERITKGKSDKFNIEDFQDMDVNDMDAETLAKVSKWYKDAVTVTTNRSKLNPNDSTAKSKDSDDSTAKSKDSDESPLKSNDKSPTPEPSKPTSSSSSTASNSSSSESSSARSKKKDRIPWMYRESGSYYRKQADRIAKDRRNRDKDVMKWLI